MLLIKLLYYKKTLSYSEFWKTSPEMDQSLLINGDYSEAKQR